jgi:ABC-type branched-subunit amino acid transport system substrate-binding protein
MKQTRLRIRSICVASLVAATMTAAVPVAAKSVSVSAGQACTARDVLDKASKLVCMPTKGDSKTLTWQKNSPSSPGDGVTKDTIKIGWMGDITGPTASAQAFNYHGLQSYVNYRNANGGLLGRQLELIALDDKYSATTAAVNFDRLASTDKVLTIAGMGGSHISGLVDAKMSALSNPLNIVGAQQTTIVEQNSANFFSWMQSYSDIADVALSKFLKLQGGDGKKIVAATFALAVPSGTEYGEWIKKKVTAVGGKYCGTITEAGTSTDHTAAVTRFKALLESCGANSVGLHGSPGFVKLYAVAADKAGLGKYPHIGIHGIASPVVYDGMPASMTTAIQGVHAFAGAGLANKTEGGKIINKYMKGKQYGNEIDNPNFVHGWVNGMIVSQAIENAWSKTGKVTRSTLRAALKAKFDTLGLSCPVDLTRRNYSPCAAPMKWTPGRGLVVEDSFAVWNKALTGDKSL